MKTQITSFVLTTNLKELLKQWAAQNDRTLSAELRQILIQEAARRQQINPNKQN